MRFRTSASLKEILDVEDERVLERVDLLLVSPIGVCFCGLAFGARKCLGIAAMEMEKPRASSV